MLGPFMENLVGGNLHGRLVVIIQGCGAEESDMQILKEKIQPLKFMGSGSKGSIFCLK